MLDLKTIAETIFTTSIFIYILTSLKLYSSRSQLNEITTNMDSKSHSALKHVDNIRLKMVFIDADLYLLDNEIDLLSQNTISFEPRAKKIRDLIKSILDNSREAKASKNELPQFIHQSNNDMKNANEEITEYKKYKIEIKYSYYIFLASWVIAGLLKDIEDDAYIGYVGIFIIVSIIQYFGMREYSQARERTSKLVEKSTEMSKKFSNIEPTLKSQSIKLDQIEEKFSAIVKKADIKTFQAPIMGGNDERMKGS